MPLIRDLEHETPIAACTRGPDDRPQGTRHPSLAPDHLADILRSDLQSEDDNVAIVDAFDPDGVRFVHEASRDPGEQVVHGVSRYSMPAALSRRATGSDG